MKKNKITEVLGHDISWFVDSDNVTELDQVSIEHIEKCINDGLSSGELHVCINTSQDFDIEDDTASGWWSIINWRSIACDLYNAGKKVEEEYLELEKAIEKFEEEWTF